MNQNIRKSINNVGKAGRIIASILGVLLIIGAVALSAVTVVTVMMRNESINVKVNGTAEISSPGEILSSFKKVFSVKQEGDSAKIDLAQNAVDIDFRIADSGNILEDAKLTETEKGYNIEVADKNITVRMRSVFYALLISLLETVSAAVVIFILRGLMKTLEKCETPFGADVIFRMKKFGVSLIPYYVLRSTSKNTWSAILSAKESSTGFGFDIDLTLILGILIIIMLVMIFSYGAQLQKESDETV